MRPRAVITDYGGVLTNPIAETLQAFCDSTAIEGEHVAAALVAVAERYGGPPMAPLETGEIDEETFLARLLAAMPPGAAEVPEDFTFRTAWFAGRRPNEAFLEYLQGLREEGLRLALLTNNVAEWEPLWRATVPEGLFDVEVVSCDEGIRKPDPAIYELTLARLDLPASACVFVDDVEDNCRAAERLGIPTVRFRDAGQAAEEIDALLGRRAAAHA